MDGQSRKSLSHGQSRKSLSKERRRTYTGTLPTDDADEAAQNKDVAEKISSAADPPPPVMSRQKSMPAANSGVGRRASAKAAFNRPQASVLFAAPTDSHGPRPSAGITGQFKDVVVSHLAELQRRLMEEYDHRHWRLERQVALLSEENTALKDELCRVVDQLPPESRKLEEQKVKCLFSLQIAAMKWKCKVKSNKRSFQNSHGSQDFSVCKSAPPGAQVQNYEDDQKKRRMSRRASRKSLRQSMKASRMSIHRGTLKNTNDECEMVSAAKQLPQRGITIHGEVVAPPEPISGVNQAWEVDPPDISEAAVLEDLQDCTISEGSLPELGTSEIIAADGRVVVPGFLAEEAPAKADYSKRKSLVNFGGAEVKDVARVKYSLDSSLGTDSTMMLQSLEPSEMVLSPMFNFEAMEKSNTDSSGNTAPSGVLQFQDQGEVEQRPELPEEPVRRKSVLKAQSILPTRTNSDPEKKMMMRVSEDKDSPSDDHESDEDSGELWDGESDDEESDEEELFEVLELWTTDYNDRFNMKEKRQTVVMQQDGDNSKGLLTSSVAYRKESIVWEEEDKALDLEAWMMKFVLLPTSWMRLIWDFFGCIFILYDVVVIPLESFSPPENTFTRMMAWLARIFWTFDFLMNFFTGYLEPHGMMESRPTKIARRYFESWFACDVSILLCEWAEVLASGSAQAWLRRVPWLRITRIIRLRRLMRSWEMANVDIDPLALLLVGVMRNVLGILLLSHFVACFWYLLIKGDQGLAEVEDQVLTNRWSKYAVAFHWATMQFTGLGALSLPRLDNPAQVIYSIASMFLTFVISASFVSVITTSMTRYHITNDQNLVQFGMLRKYLVDNHISQRLSMRMQQNAHHVVAERNRFVPEADIELLELISEPLRVELHFEIYIKHLVTHPFFDLYSDRYPSAIRQVCHHATSQMSFFAGDLIFGDGEKPVFPRMFFVLSGSLEYSPLDEHDRKQALRKGQTISEAVLWTEWMHQGTLKVLTECRILTLDAEKFQNIAVQFRVGSFPPEIYARQFVDALNMGEGPLTDMVSEQQSALMVKRAFGTNEKRNKRAASVMQHPSDRHSSVFSTSSFVGMFKGSPNVESEGDASLNISRKSGTSILPGEYDGTYSRDAGSQMSGIAPLESLDTLAIPSAVDGYDSLQMNGLSVRPSYNQRPSQLRSGRVSFAFS